MADEGKETVVEATETQVDNDLFDEAFQEAAASEAPAKTETTSDEKPKEEAKPKEEKPKEDAPKLDERDEKIKSLEQQFTETKRWGTENAEKVAQLQRDIEALKQSKPPEEEPLPEDLKEFYDDNPEFKKAVEFEAKRLAKSLIDPSKMVDPGSIATVQAAIAQTTFNQAVCFGLVDDKGAFVEGHPDAIKIVTSKEFKDWAVKETANLATNDPNEAIQIISKFKEAKVKGALSEHDKEKAKETEERINAAGASIKSTKGGGQGKAGVNKDDYDGGWEEAVKA